MAKKKKHSSTIERGEQIKVKKSSTTINFKTKTGETIQVKGIKTEKAPSTTSLKNKKITKKK